MIKRICFVGSDIYPVLNPGFGTGYIGGESVQHTLLAKAFHALGWQVSVVDRDYGQPDDEVIDGVKVHKTFAPKAGLTIIRSVHPRLTGILTALKKADAHIYYQSCAGRMTGIVGWFCKKYKKKFIFRTAHDTDCIPGKHLIKFWHDNLIYAYGLRQADLIAFQGVKQAQLMRQHYGLEGLVVNMAVELPGDPRMHAPKLIDALWVNNMRPFKRPEWYLKLAQALPDYRFVMIGGPCPGLHDYYQKIANQAERIKNLEFLGPVLYQQVNSYFSNAKVFINTSESEGFPNSFLQAWIRGVPVISFFDPDGLITRNQLGAAPQNMQDMIGAVQRLIADERLCSEIGRNAGAFASKNYAPSAVARDYIRLFEERMRL